MSTIKELDKNVWQIATKRKNRSSQNSYILKNGDESVLIDPPAARDISGFLITLSKLIYIKDIKYILLHHQDASICSGIPYLEKKIRRDDLEIIGHKRQGEVIREYGIESKLRLIDKKSTLCFGNLSFYTTPYCHTKGSFMSYYKKSKILFSSTLFSSEKSPKNSYATLNDLEDIKQFHRENIAVRDILNYALNKVESIDLKLAAPQYGGLVKKESLTDFSNELRKIECGMYIDPDYLTSLSMVIEQLWQSEAKLKKQKEELNLVVSRRTEELQKSNTRLIETLEEKSKFMASISHELLTPLNPIINFSEYIIDELNHGTKLSEDEYRRLIKKINKHANRLHKMIHTILEKN